jgi:hypothetical protein
MSARTLPDVNVYDDGEGLALEQEHAEGEVMAKCVLVAPVNRLRDTLRNDIAKQSCDTSRRAQRLGDDQPCQYGRPLHGCSSSIDHQGLSYYILQIRIAKPRHVAQMSPITSPALTRVRYVVF